MLRAMACTHGYRLLLPARHSLFTHPRQVRILREMAAKGEVPLRQGAAQFLDDALVEGAQVGSAGPVSAPAWRAPREEPRCLRCAGLGAVLAAFFRPLAVHAGARRRCWLPASSSLLCKRSAPRLHGSPAPRTAAPAQVAVVAATASVPEDGLVSSAMYNLGPNRCAAPCCSAALVHV